MIRRVCLVVLCSAFGAFAGCGPSKSPVQGLVYLDDKPLSGATVVFTSEDGSKTASGRSDEQGNFTLSFENGPGIPAGTYKVTVTKTAAVGQMSGPGEGDAKDYIAQMMKNKSAAQSSQTGPAGPPGSAREGGNPNKTKSEVPSKYASVNTTDITVQVPTGGKPVEIKLYSK
jgi:hypothetical protein